MGSLAAENIRPDRRKYLLALIVLVVGLSLGLAGFLAYRSYWRQTPRYALWQMVAAMQANDTQTLFSFIDLPAVVDSLVDQSAGEVDTWLLPKDLELPDDQLTRWGRQLTKKFAKFLAPKVVVALEPQIRTAVANYLADLSTTERAALAAVPAQATIRQEENSAWVTLTDPHSGRSLRFRMVRTDSAGQWRIVEVNYQDLKTLIGRSLGD